MQVACREYKNTTLRSWGRLSIDIFRVVVEIQKIITATTIFFPKYRFQCKSFDESLNEMLIES